MEFSGGSWEVSEWSLEVSGRFKGESRQVIRRLLKVFLMLRIDDGGVTIIIFDIIIIIMKNLERERTRMDRMFPRMPKIPMETRSTPAF